MYSTGAAANCESLIPFIGLFDFYDANESSDAEAKQTGANTERACEDDEEWVGRDGAS